MKSKIFEQLPKHNCQKPGSPTLGFAPLDFAVMKAMGGRGASKEEVSAQIGEWIQTDAAKNPQPTTPEVKRFEGALMSDKTLGQLRAGMPAEKLVVASLGQFLVS
jgi:hypothetical protein